MDKGNCIETQICDRLPKLKAYIISRGSQGAQAEDIYCNVIVKIWNIIRNGKFKEGHSIDSFMWRCAKSVICDYYNKENREKRIYDEEHQHYFSILTKSYEREYEALMENNTFMKKTLGLRAIYRKIIILSLFQNMKHCEIANTLGIPRGTVSNYMLRMRKKLGDIHLNKTRIRMLDQ